MDTPVYLRDQLVLHPARGTFDFVARAHTLLENATASAVYRESDGAPRTISLRGPDASYSASGDDVTLSRSGDGVEVIWHAHLDGGLYAWLEFVNRRREQVQLDELRVLQLEAAHGAQMHLGAPPLDWRFYQNGWQSWSAAFVRAVGDGVHSDPATEEYRLKHQPHLLPTAPKTLSSEWFTVISTPPKSPVNGVGAPSFADSVHPDRSKAAVGGPQSVVDRPPSAVGGLLLGFTTTGDQLAEVRLQLDGDAFGRLEARVFADGVSVDPGERVTSERLLIASGDDSLTLLDTYAGIWGETMHARIPPPLTGWCTWYYFYGGNTESDVLANLEHVRAERLPLGTIVIDDGYQTSDGDWTSVDGTKFPHGMKWLADAIRRAGFTPALWVAPFAANEHSQLAREHPEYLLRDANGGTVCSWLHWNEKCFSLDLSRADVHEWLGKTFGTLSDTWGYELFKLDFLYAGAAPGRRLDPKVTRAQAVRRGLSTIRAAVGDKPLLGCGAPLGPSVGLVDAMRIGPDVSINWEPYFESDLTSPSTAYAMRNTLARAFMHNRLWQNDPDCVLVRRRDDDSSLVLNEMRTLVSFVGLSGGAVLNSDNLPTLRRGRLKYLKQVLPSTNRAALPLDLFEHELPRVFALPVETGWGQWLVAGILNWDDKTTATELALADLRLEPEVDYHVFDYWRRRYLGIARNHITLARHQPHETRLLLFKPVSDRLGLLTTTFHIAQGLSEVKSVADRQDAGSETLCVTLEKQGVQNGEVWFAVPGMRKVVAARVNKRQTPYRQVGERIVVVALTLQDQAKVELEVSTD